MTTDHHTTPHRVDLLALAERIEKASGPDRRLDAMIECELRRWQAYDLGLNDKARSHWRPIGSRGEVIDHQETVRYHAPTYTFSIDAALALVQDGWEWKVSNRAPGAHQGRAYLNNRQPHFAGMTSSPNPKFRCEEETAATPALALCATALKAKARTGGSSHGR